MIACATTAARELEYHLQLHYTEAGKSLGDREHFNLTVHDVLYVALWFNGSTFTAQEGTESHSMTLVNQHGQPPGTLDEIALLLGDAVLIADSADAVRSQRAYYAERRRRGELIDDWAERTARRWNIKLHTFNMLVVTGKLEEQIERAHEHIDQGLRPRISPMPPHIKEELEKRRTPWANLDEMFS